MQDPSKEYGSLMKAGYVELESGRIKEAFDCLAQFDSRRTNREARCRYYELKTRAYSDLDTYNTHEFHSDSNRKECIKALDSALLLSEPGSFEREKHVAELLNITGHPDKAAKKYEMLLNSRITDHQRAMVAYDLSLLTDSVRLLTLSAICDIRSSENRTLAAFELGKLLFQRGDLANAKIVLQLALDQANIYGASLRTIEIEANLNRVGAQMLIDSENKKNRVLIILLTILVIAIAATALISINVYRRLKRVRERERIVQQQNEHLDKINKKLLEDAGIKEEYIGYFFNIISGYIQKLEQIKRNTEHNFKMKHYDEVLKLTNGIDIKHERHELFYTFDKIFLKLFPNFITTFNSLLKPEDQIWPKHNEALNTNLRIFALMRLGIRDNQTIANILESSLSTVYTYKTRIKSKALFQGDEFDNKIMEIQFISVDNV
jgi:tetratricopeptide (TPR) repeat protein